MVTLVSINRHINYCVGELTVLRKKQNWLIFNQFEIAAINIGKIFTDNNFVYQP